MKCMNCDSTNDVIDFVSGEETIILCAECRYKLATGKLNVKQVGRPPLGVTKKVSLTLPKRTWEHVDKEAEGNRSDYFRKLLEREMHREYWSRGDWSNNACLGYAIFGAKRLGYSEEQTQELIRAIYRAFDEKTIEEARQEYERSPY